MTIGKHKFYSLLLFILVLLPIYKDSPLSLYLGAGGYTMVMPISLILFTIYLLMNKYKNKNEYVSKLFKLGIWLFVVSVCGLSVWLLLDNPIVYLGEFLPFKAIKVILQYISYPCYIYLLILCIRNVGEKKVLDYCFLIMIFLLIINIIEKFQMPYAFKFLHFDGVFPYNRIRLLTLEASETTSLIISYCGLSIYGSLKYKKYFNFIISILSLVIFTIFTSSKSLMLSIGLFLIIYIIFELKKSNKNKKIFFVILLIILGFIIFILPRFNYEIVKDIHMFTSTTTRVYTIIVGIIIGVIFPFGVGCAAHLGVLKHFLGECLFIINIIPIKLNLSEINNLINSSSDKVLTVKSGLIQYNLYWGIIGTLYFLNIFKSMFKKMNVIDFQNKVFFLSMFLLCILMLIILNMNFECFIIFALAAIIIEKESEKNEKSKNRNNIS